MDGDSHNDIKRGYLKCWSSMAEADIVFPNPSDLAGVAVVSESLKVLTRFSRIRYSRTMKQKPLHGEVRFHLSNDAHYMHWQVKVKQGSKTVDVYYYNPNEYQLEMRGCIPVEPAE